MSLVNVLNIEFKRQYGYCFKTKDKKKIMRDHLLLLALSKSKCVMTAGHLLLLQLLLSAVKF
jgi:hypothetical protein